MDNIFKNLPQDIDKEVFTTLLDSSDIKIERIVSRGHKSAQGTWYDQEKDEWVMVLRGAAILEFEDRPEVTLREGDYFHLPAHMKHKVQWTDPEVETVWLAIHY